MSTPAIFHSCAFFPPFPKPGSKCTDRKTDLGACSHARCRKQVHVAAPALPSVLPHYPALRAVPAAPTPAGARAWRGWLSASSHPFFPSHLLPLHHTNHHPQEFAAGRRGCPHLFLSTPSLCASVYRPAGQREARAAAASGRACQAAGFAQGRAGSREGQAGGGQDWGCAAPLTTLGEHRVRRLEPPTKLPAALRSPILSS